MGIYRHLTDEQLTQKRDRLLDSLEQRLTGPTAASAQGRSVQYGQQTDAIRKELEQINAELDVRTGTASHRPIYLV